MPTRSNAKLEVRDERIVQLYQEGSEPEQIRRRLHVGISSVHRVLFRYCESHAEARDAEVDRLKQKIKRLKKRRKRK